MGGVRVCTVRTIGKDAAALAQLTLIAQYRFTVAVMFAVDVPSRAVHTCSKVTRQC
jgi:hypothetical protein